MDCVTPSHPDKIPPGESLDINQLLSKGSEAYLDTSIKPSFPPVPGQYAYTPRAPIISSLETSQDPAFIRAQITNDDKELREIIKEVVRAHSPSPKSRPSANIPRPSRKPRSESNVPRPAEPQKAILMEVQPSLLNELKTPINLIKPPQFALHRYGWKPRPSTSL